MKRIGIWLEYGAAVLLALIAAVGLSVVEAADQASIIIQNMPKCLTPGQKVTVTAFVTNTGTVPWTFPATPCPPNTVIQNLPGTKPDCRHTLGYFINGTSIKGERNEWLIVKPGETSRHLDVNFCASDTSATRNCNASNPPLPAGTYTVNWQVVHEWVEWIPSITSFTFTVTNDCSAAEGTGGTGKLSPGVIRRLPLNQGFYDLSVSRISLSRSAGDYYKAKEYFTGYGSSESNSLPPEGGKAWNVAALPEAVAGAYQLSYRICCQTFALLPPREQITKEEAAHWGDGKHLVKVSLKIHPPSGADGPAIAECSAEKIMPVGRAWTWDEIQARHVRTVIAPEPVCIEWVPKKADIGRTFTPQCSIYPEGGWIDVGLTGYENLTAMYPQIKVVSSEGIPVSPEMMKKLKQVK